jgi:tetratricopeptide (TPR) repeat protein
LAKGDSQDAVNCLKRSVRIKPDYVMGHYNLALAYFLNLENDKAVSQIAEVIKLDPSKKNTIQKDGQFKFILRSQEFLEWEKMSGAWEDPAAKE